MRVILVAWGGIEPPTQGFSIWHPIFQNQATNQFCFYKCSAFECSAAQDHDPQNATL
jgi:hypothetical protein